MSDSVWMSVSSGPDENLHVRYYGSTVDRVVIGVGSGALYMTIDVASRLHALLTNAIGDGVAAHAAASDSAVA